MELDRYPECQRPLRLQNPQNWEPLFEAPRSNVNVPTLHGRKAQRLAFSAGWSWVLWLLLGMVKPPDPSGLSGVKLGHAQSRSGKRTALLEAQTLSPITPGCQRAAHPGLPLHG